MSPTYEQLDLPLPAAAPPFDARSGPTDPDASHPANASLACPERYQPATAVKATASCARSAPKPARGLSNPFDHLVARPEDEPVLRIYLDQNKWVDLARAATGHRLGGRFSDALTMARAGVASGAVSFPLDIYRYWETSKRGDNRSRNEVVDVMRELSRQHTMALPFGILDEELDLALQRRFGRPSHPRRQQVFGIGMQHISGGSMSWPKFDLNALPSAGSSVPGGLRAQLDQEVTEIIEEYLLRAGPDAFGASGFDHTVSDHGQRFVDFENILAAVIAERRLRTPNRMVIW